MKQTYRLEAKIPRREFNAIGSEEYLIRDAVRRMINDIPLDKIAELFNIKIIDPEKEIDKEGISYTEIDYMRRLLYDNVVKIEGEVTI